MWEVEGYPSIYIAIAIFVPISIAIAIGIFNGAMSKVQGENCKAK